MQRRAPKRVLATGAGGFLGRHLCPLLAEEHEVMGLDLEGVAPSFEGVWREVDALHTAGEMLEELKPDILVHAAFRNRKPPEWSRTEYLASVLDGNLPLFQACAERGIELVLCSSSAVYGVSPDGRPLAETDPVAPVSQYGVAKALQEMLLNVFAYDDLQVCTVRLFNLIGPGQPAGMLISDWLRGVALIAGGGEPVLRVRNRSTSRDFVDVRDAARALRDMVSEFRAGEVVNVAGGRAVHLMDVSRFLEALCPVPFEIVETDAEVDATDVKSQCGDASRARMLWAWTPTIDWRESLTDAWREMLEGSGATR